MASCLCIAKAFLGIYFHLYVKACHNVYVIIKNIYG